MTHEIPLAEPVKSTRPEFGPDLGDLTSAVVARTVNILQRVCFQVPEQGKTLVIACQLEATTPLEVTFDANTGAKTAETLLTFVMNPRPLFNGSVIRSWHASALLRFDIASGMVSAAPEVVGDDAVTLIRVVPLLAREALQKQFVKRFEEAGVVVAARKGDLPIVESQSRAGSDC